MTIARTGTLHSGDPTVTTWTETGLTANAARGRIAPGLAQPAAGLAVVLNSREAPGPIRETSRLPRCAFFMSGLLIGQRYGQLTAREGQSFRVCHASPQ
ncbi:hypothetical protein ACQP2E_20775 [Actinoplanes sp. CA-015351]|uniref:hypothetical protein n=1 Tax=Actinoplanes sp. CA-015351 TaxID=3239897 RepID=UPI003D97A3D7